LFAGSQTSPACPDKYSVKVKMGVECSWSDTDGEKSQCSVNTLIHFNIVHHCEMDLPGIKQDPCGKRSTSRLNYGTAIFKTDPSYLTENTPRARCYEQWVNVV
jgi:hypothetical protein